MLAKLERKEAEHACHMGMLPLHWADVFGGQAHIFRQSSASQAQRPGTRAHARLKPGLAAVLAQGANEGHQHPHSAFRSRDLEAGVYKPAALR